MTATLAAVVWADADAGELERTLETIALGPHRATEVCVYDAPWAEGVDEVAAAFGRRHPALRYERVSSVLERGALLARGLEDTRATWLLLLASGDALLPSPLERALELATNHPDAGAVLGRAVVLDPAGTVTDARGVPGRAGPSFEPPARFRAVTLDDASDPFAHAVACATLVRREALVGVGGVTLDLGPLALPFALWAVGAVHGAACLAAPLVDERGAPSAYERLLVENPVALLRPLDALSAHLRTPLLATSILGRDAERLEGRLRARIVEAARTSLLRACDVLDHVARAIAPDRAATGEDRLLALALRGAAALERRLLRGAATGRP